MAFRGIDIREAGDRIVFRFLLQDSNGAKVTSGSASLRLYELQNDGSLKSFDFNDNTFKTTALTTATLALTHRTADNGSYNTGVWSSALTTLTGFTAGNIYLAEVAHASASPSEFLMEFQYGSGVLADVIDKTGFAPTTTQIVTAVDSSSTKLDVAVSTRLSQSSYEAPANVDIAGIRVATDKLDSLIEGTITDFRFTTEALQNAPTGGTAPTTSEIVAAMDATSTQLATIKTAAQSADTKLSTELLAHLALTLTAEDLGTLLADVARIKSATVGSRTVNVSALTVTLDDGTVWTYDADGNRVTS
jgi:hypothetical protein